jgi:phage terminase large subunit
MLRVQEVSTGYTPRVLQDVLHRSLKRFNVVVCHRRFGKTVFSLNETVDKALRNDRHSPQYAYVAPTYGQAKRVAWDMLKDVTKNIPGVIVNEAELRVDIPRPAKQDRIRIMLLGAENPGNLRGIYLDGVILDEYAEMDPIIWSQVLRPALSDRLGWAIFIGTPKGQNGFYDIYQQAQIQSTGDWFHAMYKASETGVIPTSELDAAKQIMSEEEYEQEYECSFSAALVGAYYGKILAESEENKKITTVPHDPSLLVDTFWDLGVDDTTVIWFAQKAGREWHFFDYIEMSGEGLDYYVKELSIRKKYNYGTHFLPHDANARELGTGTTRVETLKKLGLRNVEVVERQSIEDGINAVRMVLPRCYFDKEKCARGINALKAYERRWDSKNKIYQQKPLHNWASHGADAFRTFATGFVDKKSIDEIKRYPRKSQSSYDIFGRK